MGALFAFSCTTEHETAFSVSENQLVVAADGGEQTLRVTSASEWVAIASEPCVSVSPSNGYGSVDCAIRVDSSLVSTQREAFVRFSPVEAGDGALGIEDGKALIDSLQFLSDWVIKCLSAFIFNVINRAEDGSFCGAQGGSPSEVQNPDGAGDEQQEEKDSGDGAESGALFHSVLQVQMSMRMCSEPPKACPSFFPKPGTYHGLPTAEGLLLMRNL